MEREVDVAREVYHKNIVEFIDIYENSVETCIVMEYLGGGDVYSRLNERHKVPLKEGQVKLLAKELINALDYLHGIGIAHRDIKPENLVFDRREGGRLKIIDFGFAKNLFQHGPYNSPVGTDGYSSIEIIQRHKNYTTAVDMFAVGCIIYYLLMGVPAFDSSFTDSIEKVKDLDRKIESGYFDFVPGIPVSLHGVLHP
uniref:Protein kinase domain-containing protein n=1 Tax=Arcella intermedia TaxID=1963864 RepID=A0A6B2LHK9_9EUKA